MLVQLADVHFGYPGTEIFSGVSFQVNPGDRIGLVGPNGAGKSTLMRLMAGEIQPDSGQVVRMKGRTLAYMHQSQEFHGSGTLWDTLLEPFASLLGMREELAQLERAISEAGGAGAEPLLVRYGGLVEEYTHLGGYELEPRIRRLAADLGFTEADLGRDVSTLSGGERGRVELAKAVLVMPDLLLLDEPTNHLDVDGVEHLEERLCAWDAGRAFVVISHDRSFLRAVCKDIVDIERRDLVRYRGGYERYLAEREERHARLNAAYERQKEEIARTEDFIRRNIAGQKSKQARSRRKMLEKLDRLENHRDEWEQAGRIGLRFAVSDHRGGKELVRAEGVELGYDDGPPLVRDLSLTVYRGDRIGIIGANGAGKSTLLKALIGRLPPRKGAIFLGHELRVGYFDQKLSDVDEERSLIDEIRSVRGDWNEDVARGYLSRFRFFGDEPFRKVRGLSGGERNRLVLAKLMLMPRNLLALDEPTNHLDIPACEALEAALGGFDGTLLLVSHDRYFLDRVVTRILHLDPATGHVDQHVGGYTEWKQRREAERREARGPAPPPGAPEASSEVEEARQQRIAGRLARKDRERERERRKRRIEQIEGEITELEEALARLRARLQEDHGSDWQKLNALVEDERRTQEKIEVLLGEWEALAQQAAAEDS